MPEQAPAVQTLPVLLIALLPLLAAGLGLLLRRSGPLLQALLGSLSLAGSAGIAVLLIGRLPGGPGHLEWMTGWVTGMRLSSSVIPPIPLAFRVDYTQLLFILTTCLIGIAVILYAIRERRDDPQAGQFHALLAFFAGSMLLFLVSDTLLLIYFAWELMGLAGYLLIRHGGTAAALRAARQAFWTTRATDFGLLFAMFIYMFGLSKFNIHWVRLSQIDIASLSSQLNAAVQQAADRGMNLVDAQTQVQFIASDSLQLLGFAFLLVLLAVVGKAAMLPLSFWLTDAMVAPAPVSALLHSATLVAAGPLLISQLAIPSLMIPQGDPGFGLGGIAPLGWTVIVGGLTLLVGAACACAQTQPKKLLAWSTVSQLGLCVLGTGALAVEASRFQLLSHAWFKAALFLAVGILAAVWHERHGGRENDNREPDLSELNGSAAQRPLLLWLGLLPALLSLAGVIGLAGYFGKEQILSALWHGNVAGSPVGLDLLHGAGAVMLLGSLPFSAAYCMRLFLALAGRRAGQPGSEEETEGNSSAGWNLATMVTVLLALLGSLGMAGFWFAYRPFAQAGSLSHWAADVDPLAAGLSMLLLVVGAFAGARSMSGGLLPAGSLGGTLSTVFREGLYFKQLITGFVGGFGEFLAILAGISDIRLIDWLATRFGASGRALANASAWLDIHFVDGIRWWCCEIWWMLRRVHGRYWQNGQIQNYMFVLLIGAVLLCIVVAIPLNEMVGRLLGRNN